MSIRRRSFKVENNLKSSPNRSGNTIETGAHIVIYMVLTLKFIKRISIL